ncbi:RNA polymerase sigma factor [Aggregatimonas sangjinii]|uniref:RNA polymerase sigma factor n=2 Tax=Aggregatimonas sangjinii TaxID=2583587 RepID=A0A5B7SZY7_9FLAO|nr:RNA polymerase sigma factor [Aggregatimonas sangjinii]
MRIKKVFDGLLVLEYQAGNKDALGQLVQRHHKKLCAHSYWYTKDIDASKDIVQDCWGIIMNKLGGLREPNSFSSWATRIVTRKSLDYVSHKTYRQKKSQAATVEETHETTGSKEDAHRHVREAIAVLPENQRIVLRLFYTEAYSLKEISTILDISVGTVKSRLFHAREKLKNILKTKL